MTWVALKSLMERRTRAALTALAVVLGVAMIAGSLIVTDSIDRAFTSVYSSSYAETDVVVRSAPVVEDSFAGTPTVPAGLLPRVRALPGVEAAGGNLLDLSGTTNIAKMVDREGEVITANAPTFGAGIDASQPRFNPFTLIEGAWARGPGEVVIDSTTAAGHGFAVGDRIGVVAEGPVRTFRITGLATFGDLDSLGGATLAIFDNATAREVLGKTGFDAIQVAARPGVSDEELARQIAPLLPGTARVATGDEQASADKQGVEQAITFIRGLLLTFGGIALFVGAFVIFNTLSITVAQRSRELATLRTLGASRRQVMRSVIAEAALIGVIASLAGLGLGLALAKGLTEIFQAAGLDLPQAETVLAGSTIAISLIAGTVVTLLAGVVPAVRATRVPPIAAVREGASLPASAASRRAPLIAMVAVGLAGAMLVRGLLADGLDTTERLLMLGGGTLALFIGVAVVSSRLVRPIAAVVGWPISRRGAAGSLASDNAVRNPSRTAATAAALMIGLALVTFVAVLGSGLTGTARSDVRDQISAGHVVTSANGFDAVPAAAGRTLAERLPGATVSSAREDRALVAGDGVAVSGIDPETIASTFRFRWAPGSEDALTRLGPGGVIVDDGFAADHGLVVGSRVPLVSPSGESTTYTVAGIHDPPDLAPVLGRALISHEGFDAVFPRPKDRYTLIAGAGTTANEIEEALVAFPDTAVSTTAEYATDATAELSALLNMLYVLLGLSVVVSVFGMVNTMALAVHERTRELGMLRAVGMTRRQVRAMVRGESVITALIGAALGIPLGVGMAALATRALEEWGVALTIPSTLAWFVVVAIAVGVLAAVMPARRASRLDVLRALQYE